MKNMKKLLAVILIAVMLISVAVFPSNAALPPLTFGDVNDDGLSVIDATIIQYHLVDKYEFHEMQALAADVDADEEITILDATYIQKKLAGLVDKFPAGDYCLIDLHFDAFVANYNSNTATVGNEIVFEAFAHSFCEPLNYKFYINGDLRQDSKESTYAVTFSKAGFYEIECVVTNKAGLSSREIINLTVGDPVETGWIVISNVYHKGFYDAYPTFVACVEDGYGPYKYKFELYDKTYAIDGDNSLGVLVETRDFADSNSFTVSQRLTERNSYTLVVTVENEIGWQVQEYFEFDYILPPPA